VLRPTHSVNNRAGALATRIGQQRLSYLDEFILWQAGNGFDHLWRVAGVVTLHNLENASRILQRWIGFRCPRNFGGNHFGIRFFLSGHLRGWLFTLVSPGFVIVSPFLCIQPGKNAIQVF
jgi:hypothetical protein